MMVSLAIALALFATAASRDGACRDLTHVSQEVLVVLRFPASGNAGGLAMAERTHVLAQLDSAAEFFWTHSNESLRIHFKPVEVSGQLVGDDYQQYSDVGAAAKYTRGLHDRLCSLGYEPEAYSGILMIYRPINAPSGGVINNTWIWYDDHLGGKKRDPGFSSIVFNSGAILGELIVHEYLHQIDHRLEREVGNPDSAQQGFMNADDKDKPAGRRLAELMTPFLEPGGGAPAFDTPREYYQAILKCYLGADDRAHPVNYRWLVGARGVLMGPPAILRYDFARDSRLQHIAGDNIVHIRPTSEPGSFWFRVQPGHTAAFATIVAYGRYRITRVSFNYELAPRDYTFKIFLQGCDEEAGKRPWKVQIDDGSFNRGRQAFAYNRKTMEVNRIAEDFRIVFEKGNELSGDAAKDDWALLGDLVIEVELAP